MKSRFPQDITWLYLDYSGLYTQEYQPLCLLLYHKNDHQLLEHLVCMLNIKQLYWRIVQYHAASAYLTRGYCVSSGVYSTLGRREGEQSIGTWWTASKHLVHRLYHLDIFCCMNQRPTGFIRKHRGLNNWKWNTNHVTRFLQQPFRHSLGVEVDKETSRMTAISIAEDGCDRI